MLCFIQYNSRSVKTQLSLHTVLLSSYMFRSYTSIIIWLAQKIWVKGKKCILCYAVNYEISLFLFTEAEKGSQCSYNVTLRRVCESFLPWKIKYYIFLCVRACACQYVHVVLLIQHATRMRHIVTPFLAPLAPSYFSTLSHKRHDFRKNLLKVKCAF